MEQNEQNTAKNSTRQVGVGSGNYKRTKYKPKTFAYCGIRFPESSKLDGSFEAFKAKVKELKVDMFGK